MDVQHNDLEHFLLGSISEQTRGVEIVGPVEGNRLTLFAFRSDQRRRLSTMSWSAVAAIWLIICQAIPAGSPIGEWCIRIPYAA